jgi:hypothetical protein
MACSGKPVTSLPKMLAREIMRLSAAHVTISGGFQMRLGADYLEIGSAIAYIRDQCQ